MTINPENVGEIFRKYHLIENKRVESLDNLDKARIATAIKYTYWTHPQTLEKYIKLYASFLSKSMVEKKAAIIRHGKPEIWNEMKFADLRSTLANVSMEKLTALSCITGILPMWEYNLTMDINRSNHIVFAIEMQRMVEKTAKKIKNIFKEAAMEKEGNLHSDGDQSYNSSKGSDDNRGDEYDNQGAPSANTGAKTSQGQNDDPVEEFSSSSQPPKNSIRGAPSVIDAQPLEAKKEQREREFARHKIIPSKSNSKKILQEEENNFFIDTCAAVVPSSMSKKRDEFYDLKETHDLSSLRISDDKISHEAPRGNRLLDKYSVWRFLGRGSFGMVFLVGSNGGGSYYRTKINNENNYLFRNKKIIELPDLQHLNALKFVLWNVASGYNQSAYTEVRIQYMITELNGRIFPKKDKVFSNFVRVFDWGIIDDNVRDLIRSHHPHVADEAFGRIQPDEALSALSKTSLVQCSVLEYSNRGNMHSLLSAIDPQNDEHFPLELVKFPDAFFGNSVMFHAFLLQIMGVLDDLWKVFKFVHWDLRVDNILAHKVDEHYKSHSLLYNIGGDTYDVPLAATRGIIFKISDFGLSNIMVPKDRSSNLIKLNEAVGDNTVIDALPKINSDAGETNKLPIRAEINGIEYERFGSMYSYRTDPSPSHDVYTLAVSISHYLLKLVVTNYLHMKSVSVQVINTLIVMLKLRFIDSTTDAINERLIELLNVLKLGVEADKNCTEEMRKKSILEDIYQKFIKYQGVSIATRTGHVNLAPVKPSNVPSTLSPANVIKLAPFLTFKQNSPTVNNINDRAIPMSMSAYKEKYNIEPDYELQNTSELAAASARNMRNYC